MLLFALITGGTFSLLCRIASCDTDWKYSFSLKKSCEITVICLAWAVMLVWRHESLSLVTGCLLCVLAGCLLMACMTDLWEQIVYRFIWWAGGGAVCLLLLLRLMQERREKNYTFGADILILAVYILIQQEVFGRLYGKADCHAFCVCAAAQTALRAGFQDYVLHMTAAFLGLVLIQGIQKNIASNGNLKKPVPFLPYIAVSFWLWVDFAPGKWYI